MTPERIAAYIVIGLVALTVLRYVVVIIAILLMELVDLASEWWDARRREL
jgi:hypothetical protein